MMQLATERASVARFGFPGMQRMRYTQSTKVIRVLVQPARRAAFCESDQGVKATPSCLQIAFNAGRAVIGPEGRPPPGITHCPTITKWLNPGRVFGRGLKLAPGSTSQPSIVPFQLPV